MAGPLTGRYHIGKYLSFLLKICERSTNIAKKLSQIKVKSKGGGRVIQQQRVSLQVKYRVESHVHSNEKI
jgi:hypothetical protein